MADIRIHSVERIEGWLRQLTVRAAHIPSAVFGIAYLACIPIFAVLYCMFPLAFYHAAAKYDTAVTAQTDEIAERLRTVYIAESPIQLSRSDVDLRLPKFEVHLESGDVQVHVFGNLPRRDSSTERWFGTMVLHLGGAMIERPSFRGDWRNELRDVYVTATIKSGHAIDPSILFPCRGRAGPCLRMSAIDYPAVDGLEQVAAGRLDDDQSSFLRMLYFSAVTITTLGYGDIVPVTTVTRSLVTIEIIMGPLLFGLFLNSLLKERPRDDGESPSRAG